MDFKCVEGYKVSKCGTIVGRRGTPLTPCDNGRGYPIVKVNIGGKWTSKAVHRFVAEAWVPNPDNLPEINHIDCDRTNFKVENLEWCSHGYNIEYSYRTKGRSATGENNSRCKTTEAIVTRICELLSEDKKNLALKTGEFDLRLVRSIRNRKNWKHISKDYVW